jgi:Yip1-like protein
MASFGERMVRAAKCDAAVYEEIEADTGATRQAVTVVVLSSVAAGLAVGGGVGGLVVGTLASLVGWALWAYLIYWIGGRWLAEPETSADWGQLLRTVGFANTPGIIRILGMIPGLRGITFFVAAVWMLVTTVIAVRQALDYRSTGRAVGVCLLGWIVQWVVLAIVLGALGR